MPQTCPRCGSQRVQYANYGKRVGYTTGIVAGAIGGAIPAARAGGLGAPGIVVGAVAGALAGCFIGLRLGQSADDHQLFGTQCLDCRTLLLSTPT